MTGKMIGVGLGPGDPDLMTLRAARVIEAAKVLAYPALPDTPSFARSIAAGLIAADAHEIVIEVPMSTERRPAQAAYDGGAARIAQVLDEGLDVVVLCEGDPFFYGSFMYLHARLAGRYTVEVVPGVTSVTAAAAQLGMPLTARNDVLTVIPGPLDAVSMRERMEGADSFVVMKVGRHIGKVRGLLDDMGLGSTARYIERATLDQEVRLPLSEAPDPAPYFSMILVTKGMDPWLKTRS